MKKETKTTKTKENPRKAYDRWDKTVIEVTKKPTKKVKRGK